VPLIGNVPRESTKGRAAMRRLPDAAVAASLQLDRALPGDLRRVAWNCAAVRNAQRAS
jgi:hypothetical protein